MINRIIVIVLNEVVTVKIMIIIQPCSYNIDNYIMK